MFLGYISEFFTWIWDLTLPQGFFEPTMVRYILLIPVLIVFITGASCYLTADLGASPYDAVPFIIYDHNNKLSFKVVRMAWDIGFMAVGFILGGAVGIVTIICSVMLGPVISFFQKKLEKFLKA